MCGRGHYHRAGVPALALDLDGVLADTRPLWRDWLEDAGRRTRVELELPDDRAAAAPLLDEQLGDWRPLLQRFAADRGPLHFRPHAETAALAAAAPRRRCRGSASSPTRRASSRTSRSRISARRGGSTRVGTLDEVLAALGGDATVVRSRDELAAAAAGYHR